MRPHMWASVCVLLSFSKGTHSILAPPRERGGAYYFMGWPQGEQAELKPFLLHENY